MQTELRLIGSVTPPKYRHPLPEIRLCTSKIQACRLAMNHAHMTQETTSERIAVSVGYMSMLMNGKRPWSDTLQRRLMKATGSLAPLQWDAMQEGVEVYADPILQREAELLSELQEIQQRKAA